MLNTNPEETSKTLIVHMGVSKNRGVYPPKWMVKIMENPIKMDDLGVPLFLETLISTIYMGLVYTFWATYFFHP